MHRALSSLLAPHYCYSCDSIGELLCQACKYNIASEPYAQCVVCGTPTSGDESLCRHCIRPYSKAWCVGEKREALEKLIDAHKFERTKDVYRVFASLLDERLPVLPSDTIIVPVPTVAKHIRQRGYDHTRLLAARFAQIRGLKVSTPLLRRNASSQRGASKQDRWVQAKEAFHSQILDGGRYLLIDDVFTTGATVEHAAKAMLEAGADDVWLAVVARQPLEK